MTRIESWPVKFGRQAKTSYAVKLTNTGDTYNVMEKRADSQNFHPKRPGCTRYAGPSSNVSARERIYPPFNMGSACSWRQQR